tara:strand:- start:1028 stop:1402 length:375 start_codon:yes stop_codon:yes gene_type:complete
MATTTPQLEGSIGNNINDLLLHLKKDVTDNHIDGSVNIAGYLSDGLGARIQLSNLEEVTDNDINNWIFLAKKSGSINENYTADLSTGTVTFDVEYKRPTEPTNYLEWLKYPAIMTLLTIALKFL